MWCLLLFKVMFSIYYLILSYVIELLFEKRMWKREKVDQNFWDLFKLIIKNTWTQSVAVIITANVVHFICSHWSRVIFVDSGCFWLLANYKVMALASCNCGNKQHSYTTYVAWFILHFANLPKLQLLAIISKKRRSSYFYVTPKIRHFTSPHCIPRRTQKYGRYLSLTGLDYCSSKLSKNIQLN